MLAYELEKPTGVKEETLKWLDHNERAGYWNCGELTHKFLECKHSNKEVGDFCYRCREVGFKINNCPCCKEFYKKNGTHFSGSKKRYA